MLGTRFFGWISRRLRRKKFTRLLLLCGRHVRLFSMTSPLPATRPRLADHLSCVTPLHQLTLFPYATPARRSQISRATLSVTFRSVLFQKKRSLPFFLARELLTQQKPVATLSRQNRLI